MFRECRSALAAIRGKSIFGIYHSTEGTLFYASWDDEASEKAAIPALCQAFSQDGTAFTESDWTDNTVGHKGKLWGTPNEVARPNAVPLTSDKHVASVMGLSAYQLTSSSNLELFKQGMDKKHGDIARIKGKGFWGYYLVGGDPTSFMFWDTQADKDSGKTDLWEVMMSTQNNHNNSADHSIHTMASGGMFKFDSSRSYHQSMVAITSDA